MLSTKKILITLNEAKKASLPKPPIKDYKIWDSKTAGLGLRIYATGVKSWIFQKKLNGIKANIVLGPYPSLTLESIFNPATNETLKGARQLAEEAGALLRQGLDPKLEIAKQVHKTKDEKAKNELTLMNAWADYVQHKSNLAGNKRPTERTLKDWKHAELKLKLSPLWKKSILEIKGSDLLKEFSRLKDAAKNVNATNEGMTQASGILRYVRAAYNYNTVIHGLESKNAFKQLNILFPGWDTTNTRNRLIGETEGSMKVWWTSVDDLRSKKIRDSVAIADWLQLSVFLGTRKTELLSLKWENVDLTHRIMVLPEEATKGRREHIIPLSEHVYSIFARRHIENINRNYEKRDGTKVGKSLYVFQASRIGTKTGEMTHIVSPSKSIKNIVNLTKVKFSAHDLRRTFATLLNEIGASGITIDKALNHAPNSTAARSYVNNPRIKYLRKTYQSLEDAILKEAGVNIEDGDKVHISLKDYKLFLEMKENRYI